MSFIGELTDLGQNYLIRSRTPKKNNALCKCSLVSMFQTAVVLLKNKKKTLINTVQGLLLTANGLDLDYWVQS